VSRETTDRRAIRLIQVDKHPGRAALPGEIDMKASSGQI
jgi:hypothetical protein